jgi:hypothetical protein
VNDPARGPDIGGEIRFLAMDKGGRQAAVRSDTPAHRTYNTYHKSGGHMYSDVERVEPGASNGSNSASLAIWKANIKPKRERKD